MNDLFETMRFWLPGGLALLGLIAASAFTSASETALFSLTRDDLRRMQTGSLSERRVTDLLRDPEKLLRVVLFWNLLFNLSYFAISLVMMRRLIHAGQQSAAATFGIVGFFALIILGEITPKCLAVLQSRRIAVLAVLPMQVASRIVAPVLPWMGMTTAMLRRVFWPHLRAEPYLDVDDIERAVETSELGVELAQLEQHILGRILELSDMTVEEVMRPRGTYPIWQPPVHLEELRRLPGVPDVMLFADDDRDTVARALPVHDVSRLPEHHLEYLSVPVIYVPWCATVADTLAQLRAGLLSVATVVNEYGETLGVITEGDILDTVLNPAASRVQRLLQQAPIIENADGTFTTTGLTTLRFLTHHLDFDVDFEDGDPVTVAALLHQELERFPVVDDECVWSGLKFHVVQAGQPGEEIQVRIERIGPAMADAPLS
jgi:Mg2+/Co2+ transporter CorB